MCDGYFEKCMDFGELSKKVGVVFKNVIVKGVGGGIVFVKIFFQVIFGIFGFDLYGIFCRFVLVFCFGCQ